MKQRTDTADGVGLSQRLDRSRDKGKDVSQTGFPQLADCRTVRA